MYKYMNKTKQKKTLFILIAIMLIYLVFTLCFNTGFAENISSENERISENNQPSYVLNNSLIAQTEPIADNLAAEPISQTVSVGKVLSSINLKNFVKNVKLGSTLLSSSQYNVSLIDNNLDFNHVGNEIAKVRITLVSDTSKTVDVDVPIDIFWGNTIVAKDNIFSKIVASVSMLDNNGTPYLVADEGDGFYSMASLGSRPYIKFYKQNLNTPSESISYTTVNQTPISLMNLWNSQLKPINSSLVYGDVISFTVFKFSDTSVNYKGANTWVSRNEKLVKETEGYAEAYYELTISGLNLLRVNQLNTNTIDVPIFSTKEYLDEHVSELVDVKGFPNIKVKGFSEYPKTTIVGQQEGKVIVEETLSTGKIVQYEYEVKVIIGEGTLKLSVPQTLMFNSFSKSKSDQIVQRETSKNLGLVINDSRGENFQGNWKLTAQISNASDGMSDYLVYRNKKGDESYLSGSAVPIYIQDKQTSVSEPLKIDVSGMWENDEGILLDIPSKNNLHSRSYSTTITWDLVEGP